MNFTYENQGTNTFIVYQVGADEQIDSMSLGMITNNKIIGFVPTIFMQQDNTKYFKYNISSKVSADQFLMGSVNKKRLLGVFNGIINAMLSAEEYMIDVNSICLDLKYVFTDVSTCETTLICLPVINDDTEIIDLKAFFKNIVFSTQFDQTENCDYVAKLINYLNSASIFSLTDFKDLLSEIEQGEKKEQKPIEQVKVTPSVQPMVTKEPQPVVQQPVQPSVSQPVVAPQPEAKKENVQQNVGFAIPGGPAETSVKPAPQEALAQKSGDEKEISLMYLMQHYNKENAAAYKSQQEAKKAAKAAAAPAKKNKKESKAKSKEVSNSAQSANLEFAIPGQQTAPNANTSTNVAPMPQPAPEQQPVIVNQPTPQQTIVPQQTVASQPTVVPQPMTSPVNFGETTVLSSSTIGETTVLGVSPTMQEIKPYLLRAKNNEKIILDKPVFRIGKEKSYVDYFIGDNTAISRSHANIITRDGEYFVVDTNSTNHTYVNGVMLQSNVETKIAHGAKIRFANEDFEFKLY